MSQSPMNSGGHVKTKSTITKCCFLFMGLMTVWIIPAIARQSGNELHEHDRNLCLLATKAGHGNDRPADRMSYDYNITCSIAVAYQPSMWDKGNLRDLRLIPKRYFSKIKIFNCFCVCLVMHWDTHGTSNHSISNVRSFHWSLLVF